MGRPLDTYLADHLAGATAGVEMFRRAAREQAGGPAGPELARLAGQVAEDREALVQTAIDSFGQIDGLVNNAAFEASFGGLEATPDADFRAAIETGADYEADGAAGRAALDAALRVEAAISG